ncbi:MAG: hypothetical protein KKA10_08190 [Euryarchaeota archaeon]|nr:hypothetical protein [Euryarchaeota archaeon]MCG2735955.1 DUF6293 family protein [Candidatus Methanoperedenaceae archaeon]
MSVLIATLGGSEDVVKLGVRKMENVDKVILIAGKPLNEIYKDSEIKKGTIIINPVQKAHELKKLLEDFYIKVEIHEVNPFDFKECLNKTIELIQSEPDKDKAVNVTGGTKTLSLAAHSAAWMCGCRAFIILEKGTGVAIKEEFPIPAAGYLDKISKQMKRILARLLMIENSIGRPIKECDDEQMRSFITKNIASSLGVEPQSIIPSLRVMESDRLIQSRRGAIKRGEPFRGKTGVKIWWLTDEGRIYATLFNRKMVQK